MRNCPSCNRSGRKVKRLTLDSLLREECQSEICDTPYFVCTTAGCSVVYFNAAGHSFNEASLRIPFGLKGTSKPVTVCYCFAFAAEDIHDEIARTGTTTVLDQIQMRMKEEGCRCEGENPVGTCCLDTVRQTIEEAKRASGSPVAREACSPGTCCSVAAPGGQVAEVSDSASPSRAGLLALLGSATAAALSSACCWVPLVLLGFGVSAGGVAAVFEAWRPTFLVVAGVLLGLGFFVSYRRRSACEGGCAPTGRMTRINRVMLWGSTAFVAAMALFPSYVGALMGRSADVSTQAASDSSSVEMVVAIEGMTCEGCEAVLYAALMQVPDVIAADVSFENKRATVTVAKLDEEVHRHVVEAVRRAGYVAQELGVAATNGNERDSLLVD